MSKYVSPTVITSKVGPVTVQTDHVKREIVLLPTRPLTFAEAQELGLRLRSEAMAVQHTIAVERGQIEAAEKPAKEQTMYKEGVAMSLFDEEDEE